MPHSIRVAVASNGAERADGHFGSCAQFLVYQVSGTDAKLVDLRPATAPPGGQDQNEHRAKLIGDCQLLYVSSIGGPAAAKVVKAGVHPIKVTGEPSTEVLLRELQAVLAASPPPWLARAMGIPAELTCHTRFCRDTE
jgi:nitrogen fixation protein NifX